MTSGGTTAPVLLLIFNRPDETARVMKAIRAARPGKLYIAADGPRDSRPGDAVLCRDARSIATQVDWPCEVKTRFQEANLGCKEAVSSGITWFFDQEPEGIILEDDTVPIPSFFRFCGELLERYRDDEEVMVISGFNGIPEPVKSESSYIFSRYPLMWGWASWRRAWAHYDKEMTQWPELREAGWLKTVGDGRTLFQKQWQKVFDECYAGEIDTWDFQWIFCCWLHSGLAALPSENLVKNIGFGPEATHTVFEDDPRRQFEPGELQFPLAHPSGIFRSKVTDRYLDKHWFEVEWNREVRRTLLKNPLIRSVAALKRQLSDYFKNRR